MKATNHVVGGYVFTGLLSSLLGWNIFDSVALLVVTFIGSLLPDIDHTKSIIGRSFFPISRMINRRYGHRTITHSVFFLLASTIVIYLLNILMSFDYLSSTYFIASFSHILFDMMTVSGVAFFYPISNVVFVLPGKEGLRLSGNNYRSELIVLIVFLLLGFLLLPLFRQGFWTTYNKSFSTLKHLHSEFKKSEDMLFVYIDLKSGTTTSKVNGYAIKTSEIDVLLYELSSGKSRLVPSLYESVVKVDFRHQKNMRFSFSTVPDTNAISFKIDSLHFCNIKKVDI